MSAASPPEFDEDPEDPTRAPLHDATDGPSRSPPGDLSEGLLDEPEPLPDNDTPWKDLIATAFPDFMAFFHRSAAEDIDWSRAHEPLDVELQKIAVQGDVGRRYADQLMKVFLRSGEEQWVLVHVEVQGTRDSGFPRRMFEYRTRIHHLYNRAVASIAVLADESPSWRPNDFHIGRWGSTTSCTFTTVKLLDYASREQELLENPNIFALAVAAHLRARASRRQWPLRLKFKLELTELLGARGYPLEKVRQILRFVDWLLLMPKSWEARYNDQVHQMQEQQRMPYVTSFERFAMEKGLERGRQEGRQEGCLEGRRVGEAALMRLIARRFGAVPERVRAAVPDLPAPAFEQLAEAILDVGSLDELEAWVEARRLPAGHG